MVVLGRTYVVQLTVTDARGCQAADSVTIEVHSAPAVDAGEDRRDPAWPQLPDGEHPVTELTSDVQGNLSPFGELQFPLDEVPYTHHNASEQARREAIGIWPNHFNCHRPHTACGDQPPASRTSDRTNNVMPSYTWPPSP